ncbi:hypothetical protein B296_00039429 [Ensete ventricosum]|uniref:Retrotransposon gag domain-containing protein n=1 Tax=Ensete ventricosum TaxID=4639 RepID=A0A426ZQZ6_ENSVE|nr:hypothetical protein B296_00039429 [Ensete ventricosum]
MRQKKDEHIGLYLTRFTKEIKAIPDPHPSLVIQAFMIEIRPSRLFWSLVERPPMIMPKMLQRAIYHRRGFGGREVQRSEATVSRIFSRLTARAPKEEDRKSRTSYSPTRPTFCLTLPERDRERFYRFYNNYRYDIDECYDLKNQIEDLIRHDHLDRFIRRSR